MNFAIRNITLGELNDYLDSDEYTCSPFVPISKIRALSHQNNPRADKSDCCLFLAYDDQKLIGYLGAITDWLFDNTTKYKVYWLSCMWVLPEYRRHGIANNLLKHAHEVFNRNVLITNFIPSSKAAFDKTALYENFAALQGIRAYVRFDIKHILARKSSLLNKLSPVLYMTDLLLNIPVWLKLKILLAKFSTKLTCQEIEAFDENLKNFIAEHTVESTFMRNVQEFEWITNYPWVNTVNKISKEASKYYFSQEATNFRQWFLKVEDKDKIVGFCMLTLFKGELKTPYLIIDDKFEKDIASIIARIIIKENVFTYISYNQKINSILKKSGLFLYTRESEYGFLISQTLKKILTIDYPLLFDGDGDGAFT